MDIQQINRADAESIRVAFKNVDGGGSITAGYGVRIVTTAASFDGISSVQSTAADIKNFNGIAARDVPINGFGKATVWGYAASIAISNVGTSITVTAGDILKPGAVSGTFFSSVTDAAMTTLLNKYIIAGQSNTISALAWVSGFVHGL
jgi:hypothetical protein